MSEIRAEVVQQGVVIALKVGDVIVNSTISARAGTSSSLEFIAAELNEKFVITSRNQPKGLFDAN